MDDNKLIQDIRSIFWMPESVAEKIIRIVRDDWLVRSYRAKYLSLGLMYGVSSGSWSGWLPSVQHLPHITGPRRVIVGEDRTPRYGWRVYTCWVRESSDHVEGSVAYDVWARNPVEAAQVISPRINEVEVVEK